MQRHHLPGDLDAPSLSRRLAEQAVGDHVRREGLVLAVSELVANAVAHGHNTATNGLTLSFESDETRLRVTVEHDGAAFDPSSSRPFHGLALVEQVVDRWSIESGSGRVQVWFEMDHSTDAQPNVDGSTEANGK